MTVHVFASTTSVAFIQFRPTCPIEIETSLNVLDSTNKKVSYHPLVLENSIRLSIATCLYAP